jgi:hypothetical protein
LVTSRCSTSPSAQGLPFRADSFIGLNIRAGCPAITAPARCARTMKTDDPHRSNGARRALWRLRDKDFAGTQQKELGGGAALHSDNRRGFDRRARTDLRHRGPQYITSKPGFRAPIVLVMNGGDCTQGVSIEWSVWAEEQI